MPDNALRCSVGLEHACALSDKPTRGARRIYPSAERANNLSHRWGRSSDWRGRPLLNVRVALIERGNTLSNRPLQQVPAMSAKLP